MADVSKVNTQSSTVASLYEESVRTKWLNKQPGTTPSPSFYDETSLVKKSDKQPSIMTTQEIDEAEAIISKSKPNAVSELLSGIKEGFKQDYKDVDSIGSFLNATHQRFVRIDAKANPLNKIKDPIKNWSEKVDAKVDDGNDEKLSLGERLWNAVKGGADIVDTATTLEGLGFLSTGVLAAGAAAAAIPAKVAGALAPVANAAGTVVGTGLTTKGVYDIATADTEEEAQKGGTELFSGGMMLAASAATAKSSLEAAHKAGVAAANPEGLNTAQAMIKNIQVTPQSIGVATGKLAPTYETYLLGQGFDASIKAKDGVVEYLTNEQDAGVYNIHKTHIDANNKQIKVTVNDDFGDYHKPVHRKQVTFDQLSGDIVDEIGGVTHRVQLGTGNRENFLITRLDDADDFIGLCDNFHNLDDITKGQVDYIVRTMSRHEPTIMANGGKMTPEIIDNILKTSHNNKGTLDNLKAVWFFGDQLP